MVYRADINYLIRLAANRAVYDGVDSRSDAIAKTLISLEKAACGRCRPGRPCMKHCKDCRAGRECDMHDKEDLDEPEDDDDEDD